MANTVNANTVYIDELSSTTEIIVGSDKNIKVRYITITATGATATIEFSDKTTGAVKGFFGVVTSGETRILDFEESPMVFPNGIDVTAISSAKVTLILDRSA